MIAVYARVSSAEQAERATILSQVDYAERWLALQSVTEFARYLDDGISGTVPFEERPESARLLADIQAGRVTAVYVYRLDRLGRNPRLILNLVHLLDQRGVRLVSMTESFDTGSPAGRAMLGMLAVFAGFERDTIADRTMSGQSRHAREGHWLGGPRPPFGYRVEEKRLVPATEPLPGSPGGEWGAVELMYSLLVDQRWSAMRIAEHLNGLGIPTAYAHRQMCHGRTGQPLRGVWSGARVAAILRNPLYRGAYVYAKRTKRPRDPIEVSVPAVVTEARWERAQELLAQNRKLARSGVRRQYLLRGLLRCSLCGLTYHGWPGSATHYYYVCGGKQPGKGGPGRCPSKNLPVAVEAAVLARIEALLQAPTRGLAELERRQRAAAASGQGARQELQGVVAALDRKGLERERILSLYRKGLITPGEAEGQLAEIATEQEALERRRRELEAQAGGGKVDRAGATALLARLRERHRGGLLTWEQQREVLEALVRRIDVVTYEEEGRRRFDLTLHYTFERGQP